MNPLKFLNLALAVFYLCGNVVFVHAAETTFWTERRRLAKETQSPLLASLPLPLTQISKPIPHTSPSFSKLTNQNRTELDRLLAQIPFTAATIQEVSAGNTSLVPVLLIQDIHLNLEAQKNTSVLLDTLMAGGGIATIGVEGAFRPFDFSPYLALPEKEITHRVAKEFFENNLMGAPSFTGFTTPHKLSLMIGVDDEPLYEANVDAYLRSRKIKNRIARKLEKIRERQTRAFTTLESDAKNLVTLQEQLQRDEVTFGAYLEKLAGLTEDEDLSILQFLEAYQIEQSLDFNQVERQRKQIIEKLAASLTEAEMEVLFKKSVAFQAGQIGFASYYRDFRDLCASKKISLKLTPAFDTYVRYVLLADSLDVNRLLNHVAEMEKAAEEKVASRAEDRQLLEEARQRRLTEKLSRFELTLADWTLYQSSKALPDFKSSDLEPYETFYRKADARSTVMLEKLLAASGQGTRVLVTGGFHAPEMAEILKVKKIPYAIISPKITKVDGATANAYLSVFEQEKSPLDVIFKGERLFVYPRHLNIASDVKSTHQFNSRLNTERQTAGAKQLAAATLFPEDAAYTKKKAWLESIPTGIGAIALTALATPLGDGSFQIDLLQTTLSNLTTHQFITLTLVTYLASLGLVASHWIRDRLFPEALSKIKVRLDSRWFANTPGGPWKRNYWGIFVGVTLMHLSGMIGLLSTTFLPFQSGWLFLATGTLAYTAGHAAIHFLWNNVVDRRSAASLSHPRNDPLSAETAFVHTDHIDELTYQSVKTASLADVQAFNLMDNTANPGKYPLSSLDDIDVAFTDEFGRVINVQPDQLVIVRDGLLYSPAHLTCVSGDFRLLKEGRLYRAHFHIRTTKANGMNEGQYFLAQMNRIYAFLSKNGYTDAQLVVNLDNHQEGFGVTRNAIYTTLKRYARQHNLNLRLYPAQTHDINTKVDTLNTPSSVLARHTPTTEEASQKPFFQETAWLPLAGTPEQVAHEWLKQFPGSMGNLTKVEVDAFIGYLLASSHYPNAFVAKVHSIIIQNLVTEIASRSAKAAEETWGRDQFAVFLSGDFAGRNANFNSPIEYLIFPGNSVGGRDQLTEVDTLVRAALIDRGFTVSDRTIQQTPNQILTALQAGKNIAVPPSHFLDFVLLFGTNRAIEEVNHLRDEIIKAHSEERQVNGTPLILEQAIEERRADLQILTNVTLDESLGKSAKPAFFLHHFQSVATLIRLNYQITYLADPKEIFERLFNERVISESESAALSDAYDLLVGYGYHGEHFPDHASFQEFRKAYNDDIVPILNRLLQVKRKKEQTPENLLKKFREAGKGASSSSIVTFEIVLDLLSRNKIFGNKTPNEILSDWRNIDILDIGAGPTLPFTHALEETLGTERVYAVDPRLPETTGRFQYGTIEKLPQSWTNKFDVAISFFVFNSEVVDGAVYGDTIDVQMGASEIRRVLKNGEDPGYLIIVAGPGGMGEREDDEYYRPPSVQSRDRLVEKFGEPIFESNAFYIFKNDAERMRKANLRTMAGGILLDVLESEHPIAEHPQHVSWLLSHATARSLNVEELGKNHLTEEEADKLASLFEDALGRGLRTGRARPHQLSGLWKSVSSLLRYLVLGDDNGLYMGPVNGTVAASPHGTRHVFTTFLNQTDEQRAVDEIESLVKDLERDQSRRDKSIYAVAPEGFRKAIMSSMILAQSRIKVEFLDVAKINHLTDIQAVEGDNWRGSTYHILTMDGITLPEDFLEGIPPVDMDLGKFRFYTVKFIQATMRLMAIERANGEITKLMLQHELAGQST